MSLPKVHLDVVEGDNKEAGVHVFAFPSPAPADQQSSSASSSSLGAPQPVPSPVHDSSAAVEPNGVYPILDAPTITLATVASLASLQPMIHRATRASSNASPRGRMVEPKLVEVVPTSETASHDSDWWSKKTAEEALQLLVDPNSGIGLADTKHWTPSQLSRVVDLCEQRHYAVLQRKRSGARYGWNNTPGVNIAFNNINYVKRGIKRLQNITGYFRAGSMVAVIGAPDAGVTTFFDVLTNRHQGGEVSGDVVLNGRPRDKSFNRMVTYVMKDDIHMPLLTVKETLTFSAKLRMSPSELEGPGLSLRVDLNIKLLGLKGCANTIIGSGELRGISGGERRRVTIGSELVSGSPVVVMDLPTNGLDSATAYDIMSSLKQQSLGGRSFICSLAQPSPELLRLFDTIMVLSKGACIYFGPRTEVLPYFAALGFHCPPLKPAPEFLEELSAIPHRFYGPNPGEGKDNKEVTPVVDVVVPLPTPKEAGYVPPTPSVNTGITMEAAWTTLVQSYQRSVTFEHVKEEVARELASGKNDDNKVKDVISSNNYEYNSSYFAQAKLCSDRQFTELLRNLPALRAMLVSQVILGLMLGSLFWQLGDAQSDARTRFGLIFFCCQFISSIATRMIPGFLDFRPIYYVQKQAGYYHGAAYYLGRFMMNFPVSAVETLVFSLIMYSMSGLTNQVVVSGEYWFFWLTLYTMSLTAKGFSTAVAAVSKSTPVALGIAPIFFVLFTMFAGFMAPYDSMPVGWQWLYWLSFLTYSMKALMINEVWNKKWSCNPGETLLPGVIDNCQLSDGHSALQLYDMDATEENYKWKLYGYLICFFVGLNLMATLALLYIDHSNRDSAEVPNWDESTIGKKKKGPAEAVHDDHGLDPALAAALKPEPAFISWENLSYVVDLPPQQQISARAAKKEAKQRAKMEAAEAKLHADAPQIEMAEVKKQVVDDEVHVADKPLKRTLLQDCYGYAKPGMMVALMGGSGAGKTTLLDVLAGKKTGGDIVNGPLINGKPRDLSFNRIAGYVEQFDSHDETATVREAITFSAMLRLPAEMSYEMKMAKVESVIQTLRLAHVQNQQIGNVVRGGISPELRKKVTIAVELVMDPGMLFLDEPTTGLDSAGALAVMHAVRKLSDKISVICTIHQPSIEIVNCFTHILLLNKWRERGRVAYFGPLKGMAPFFSQSGLGEFEEGTNLAEFGLESLKQAERKGVNAAKLYANSSQGQQTHSELKAGIVNKAMTPTREYSTYAASTLVQTWQITKRFFFNYIRDIPTIRSRIGLLLIIAFLIGTLYWQSSYSQKGAANRVAMIYLSCAFPAFSAMGRLPTVLQNRMLYFREKNSAMYSPLSYYLGRFLGDAPIIAFEILIYCTLIYWIAGLRSDDHGSHFGLFLFVVWMMRNTGFAFVEFFGGLAAGQEAAVAGIQTLMVMFQLFAGFLIRKGAIPAGWIWMHYLSPFKYPIAVLVANELSGLNFNCDNNDGATLLPFSSSVNITNVILKSAAAGGDIYCTGTGGNTMPCYACPITTGDGMLSVFDMPSNMTDRHIYLASIAIMLVGYRILAFMALRFKNHIKK